MLTRTRFADGVGIRGTPRHATTRSSNVTGANFHSVRPSWRVLLKNRQTAYYYYCRSTRPADEKAFWRFHSLTARDVGKGAGSTFRTSVCRLRYGNNILTYLCGNPLSAIVCRAELVFGDGGNEAFIKRLHLWLWSNPRLHRQHCNDIFCKTLKSALVFEM